MDTILFLKARDKSDQHTGDLFHVEQRTRSDGVTQGYRVADLPPNRFKGLDPVKATPELFEGQLPPKQDLPTVEHDGDTWYIVSTGAVGQDGKVLAHLSSATRMQGAMPAKAIAWVMPPGAAGQLAKAIVLMRCA